MSRGYIIFVAALSVVLVIVLAGVAVALDRQAQTILTQQDSQPSVVDEMSQATHDLEPALMEIEQVPAQVDPVSLGHRVTVLPAQ